MNHLALTNRKFGEISNWISKHQRLYTPQKKQVTAGFAWKSAPNGKGCFIDPTVGSQGRALVVGGGVAGLATAAQLAKEGMKVRAEQESTLHETNSKSRSKDGIPKGK